MSPRKFPFAMIIIVLIMTTSLSPIAAMGQSATPVIEQATPTQEPAPPATDQPDPIDEVTAPPSTPQVDPPLNAANARMSTASAELPTVYANGQTESFPIPVGHVVTITAGTDSEWKSSTALDCSSAPPESGNWVRMNLNVNPGVPQSRTFWARSTTDSSVTGNCLTVTWTNAPVLKVNEQTGDVTIPTPSFANLEVSPNDSHIGFYHGLDCQPGNYAYDLDGRRYLYTTQNVYSMAASTMPARSGVIGNCVNLTVVNPPTISIDGLSDSVVKPRSKGILLDYSSGAEWNSFASADCSGSPMFTQWQQTVDPAFGYVGTVSIQVRWIDQSSIIGNCIEIELVQAPIMWINDQTAPLIVPLEQSVTLSSSEASQRNFFNSADCTGDPQGDWSNPPAAMSSPGFATFSFLARLTQHPHITSNCVTVTWRAATPEIRFDGDTSSRTVPNYSQLLLELPEGSEYSVVASESCDDIPGSAWMTSPQLYVHASSTLSFQARWIGDFNSRGNCITITWEPVSIPVAEASVCGSDNDPITMPKSQPGISVEDTNWMDDTRTITLVAEGDYEFAIDQQTEFIFTDPGPCDTDPPIPPVQADVCGPANDIISFASDQPEHVIVIQSDAWNGDGTWTVTLTSAENHKLPEGTLAEFVFTDASTPCPTDAPAPPVQSAICGPDNDLVSIPDDQPEGVTVGSDTGWKSNTRTITFAIDPAFTTTGKTTYTFTDAAIDCPVVPTGRTVNVVLQTSDGGSAEGAEWQLYAPVAAQNIGTDPYARGTVDATNIITIDELVAGQYRLVISADGYDPVDTTFTVTEGTTPQEIAIVLHALQPAATVAPIPAQVNALPETGTGVGNNLLPLALSGLMAALAASFVIGRRTSDRV